MLQRWTARQMTAGEIPAGRELRDQFLAGLDTITRLIKRREDELEKQAIAEARQAAADLHAELFREALASSRRRAPRGKAKG